MSECIHCDQLLEFYRRTPQAPRDYWLMTEIFVAIHGSDVCNTSRGALKIAKGVPDYYCKVCWMPPHNCLCSHDD